MVFSAQISSVFVVGALLFSDGAFAQHLSAPTPVEHFPDIVVIVGDDPRDEEPAQILSPEQQLAPAAWLQKRNRRTLQTSVHRLLFCFRHPRIAVFSVFDAATRSPHKDRLKRQ